MKRTFVFFFASLLVFSSPAFGQFKDVPAGHWSSRALWDLVRMGVTQGYPDGTFLGEDLTTRIDIAVFLAKLARHLGSKRDLSPEEEKLLAEFRSEVASLKRQVAAMKDMPRFELKGSASVKFLHGSTFNGTSESASRLEYRVRTELRKVFREGADSASSGGASIKIEFDTIDAGIGGIGSDRHISQLINAEGSISFDTRPLPIKLRASVGPHLVPHVETSPAFPSENYTVFAKPKTMVEVSSSSNGIDLALAYAARYPSISGEVRVHEISATTGFTMFHIPHLNKLRFYLTPRYLFSQDKTLPETHDSRGEFKLEIVPSARFKTKLVYGTGAKAKGDDSYINFGLLLDDAFNTGTSFLLDLHTVGSDYRVAGFDKHEFIPLNIFDKLILDGTSDLSLSVSQKLAESVRFVLKADQVMTRKFEYGNAFPGTSLTLENGLYFTTADRITMGMFYRVYHVPSGVEFAGDAEMSSAVHKNSSLFGMSLNIPF